MSQQATSSTPVDPDAIAPPSYTANRNTEPPTDEKIAIEYVFPLNQSHNELTRHQTATHQRRQPPRSRNRVNIPAPSCATEPPNESSPTQRACLPRAFKRHVQRNTIASNPATPCPCAAAAICRTRVDVYSDAATTSHAPYWSYGHSASFAREPSRFCRLSILSATDRDQGQEVSVWNDTVRVPVWPPTRLV